MDEEGSTNEKEPIETENNRYQQGQKKTGSRRGDRSSIDFYTNHTLLVRIAYMT